MSTDETAVPTGIDTLGTPRFASPVKGEIFVDEGVRVLLHPTARADNGVIELTDQLTLEPAGPRDKIYFDPSKSRAAIVTCGGLCPGINSVIRALVMTLHYRYGVKHIFGVRYGLEGFIPEAGHDFAVLTPESVKRIHRFGGTILGSSRGAQSPEVIVDILRQHDIQMLFLIGGNGTMRAAQAIYDEVQKQGLAKSIVGLPKTIDNDIFLVPRSFGFQTAVDLASQACNAAHVEAEGAYNGIGLVKVMGRDAGFIGANAALASKEVNFLLIPEIDFDLNGENGVLSHLEQRIATRHHALVLVSEGAGQRHLEAEDRGTDASGNPRLGDIGIFFKERIAAHFKKRQIPATIKYIDPSYIVRSVPPNASDNIYCGFLGQHAVHAAMAGKTGLCIAERCRSYVHLPLTAVNFREERIDPQGPLWRSVLETTGQPASMKNG